MTAAVHVYTSAALNYVPKVRMLFRSLRRHHPQWQLHLLLADALPEDLDTSAEPFDTITPVEELGIPAWRGWAFCHRITELATAIKPWMLERLLERSEPGSKVLYLDPDTVVFSPLHDVIACLEEASLALTPHQTVPESNVQAVIDNEICSLKHGVYNLGFIGVSNTAEGRAFARWWAERTYYFCRDDISNGLFTDQRWIDLVPALFSDVAILRSGRFNLATWNITTRQLTGTAASGYQVDGEPLGFYHFTGFDSGAHRVMALKNGGGNPALQELIEAYATEIAPLADDPLSHRPWAFGRFASGQAISPEQRLVYRLRRDLQRAFPDPFAEAGYERWWQQRARAEYPQLMGNPAQLAAARQALSTPLTPGFTGGEALEGSSPKLSQLLQQALRNPRNGLDLCRRGWSVLRQEGPGGLRARLQR
jgi:hypothetical protein